MITPTPLDFRTRSLMAVAFVLFLVILACTVDTKKSANGEDKDVNIETPVGDLHVSKGASTQDTGLAVYPGARMKEKKSNGEDNNANVSISTSVFGLKVATAEYQSDDPPSKIQSFYTSELGKYGKPIECHTDEHGGDLEVTAKGKDKDSDHASAPVACKGANTGKILELKVGTQDNQRVVSIEPQGKGSDFTVIYVKLRGKQGSI